MYEISTKKTTRITLNTADQTAPGVYGNYIVWQDTRNGENDIYLQNLATKVQTRVTFGIDAFDPAIYGNKIVYLTGYDQIMLYDISTKKTTAIGGGSPYSLSIYGNQILYNDMYTGQYTILHDFSTKKSIKLPFNYVTDPAIYSNKIVYDDTRNGNYDIYMAQI
jgi:beta propeller repeat protein